MTLPPEGVAGFVVGGSLAVGLLLWSRARRGARRMRARLDRLENDLTALRDEAERLTDFQTLFDDTREALFLFEAGDHRLLRISQGGVEMLRHPRDALLGRPLLETGALGDEADFLRHKARLTQGPALSAAYESQTRHPDGTRVPLEVFLQYIPARPHQPARFMAAARDIRDRKADDEARRRLSAELEAILANIPVGISLISPDRRILKVNTAFCDIYGGREEEFLQQATGDFYARREDYEAIAAEALPTMLRGETYVVECPMLRRHDRRELWCRLSGRLIDPANPGLGYVWAHDDITERRRTEQSLRDRQDLFEQMFMANGAMKMLLDPADGHIVDANPAAARFYGYDLERLRSLRIGDINVLPPDLLNEALDQASHGPQYYMFRHRLADGTLRDVEIYAGPVVVQGRPLLFSIIHDVSERLRMQADLIRRTEELQRSNEDLESFAYVASHDLRQPLRMISSYLSLLERTLGERLDQDGRDYLGFARDGAKRMDHLIQDLLDYARVGRRDRPLTAVSLQAVLEETLLHLGGALKECGAELRLPDSLPSVLGDAGELQRLLLNLFSNALKYRSPQRPPEITLSVERQGGDWRFCVADNGIGIDPEFHDRIFGLFQRLHLQSQYDGTGIGLAVCKRIVDHHGGRIWVESAPDQGARFFFTLPRLP